jgi:hypothetical protein
MNAQEISHVLSSQRVDIAKDKQEGTRRDRNLDIMLERKYLPLLGS